MMEPVDPNAIGEVLAHVTVPVLFAGQPVGGGDTVVVHTARRYAKAARRELRTVATRPGGRKLKFKVRAHRPEAWDHIGSLQALCARFGEDRAVADPTAAIERARALVRFAGEVRARYAEAVDGLFVSSWQRTIFVVLRDGTFQQDGTVDMAAVRGFEAGLVEILDSQIEATPERPRFSLRLGYERPTVAVAAIDDASAEGTWRVVGRTHGFRWPGMVAAMLTFGAAANASAKVAAPASLATAAEEAQPSRSTASGVPTRQATTQATTAPEAPAGGLYVTRAERLAVPAFRDLLKQGFYFGDWDTGAVRHSDLHWYRAPGTADRALPTRPALAVMPGISAFADGFDGQRDYAAAMLAFASFLGTAEMLATQTPVLTPVAYLPGEESALPPGETGDLAYGAGIDRCIAGSGGICIDRNAEGVSPFGDDSDQNRR